MKILFVLAFFTLSFASNAQSTNDQNDLDQQLKAIQQKYNLDEDQAAHVKVLLLDKQGNIDNALELKGDTKLYNAEQFKINKEFQTSLNELLTEEQRERFKNNQSANRTKIAKDSKKGKGSKMSMQSSSVKKNN